MYVHELAELCVPDQTQFVVNLPDGHFQMLRDPDELISYYGDAEIATIALDQRYCCIELNLY